ncbi:efflux RND transporter periplasmic adaptor subunit [Chitinophaga sancti]|uniref:Efflux RND transporter periplasmic adaptor subunit n=1 Tax=Chitinophaga sancti TaxID=1004 RepID=A0A1K1NCD3_9BACT|nr:efflux RND transporter periplasmic adaptor subunit [Chitinophaga sancti]WQD63333.1 efflux RND transporter periplasmic adaptor subunit [Chitinophaga sancti]WQG91041.1 efflux RND transporter periplasmic adaptor subunit [Chitinophaga sancti]SFW33112.1 RND family efflux transporter, MFP subunit [Chitinophaga sancti]
MNIQHRLVIIGTAVSMLAACREAVSKKKKEEQHHAGQYTFSTVVQEPLSSSIQLPAVLDAYQKVSIYPRANGFVKSVSVDRGSVVRKGQMLLQLDAPEVIQQYYAAQAKWLQAKADYAASRDNYERTVAVSATPGTISPHDLEVSDAKMLADSAIMNSQLANFRALEATRSYLQVTAPFDGVITERNVHPGALVGPTTNIDGRPMLMLEQEDRLRLIVQVPEIYSAQLTDAQKVSFRVNALPGKVFTGTISRQAGSLNDRFRSEAVEVDVYNPDHTLKPGMYAEITIPVSGSRQAMVVPATAIVTSTEKKYVIAVRSGVTHWVDVQEGNHHNDSTEVFGSLQLGDKVIAPATDDIKENTGIE